MIIFLMYHIETLESMLDSSDREDIFFSQGNRPWIFESVEVAQAFSAQSHRYDIDELLEDDDEDVKESIEDEREQGVFSSWDDVPMEIRVLFNDIFGEEQISSAVLFTNRLHGAFDVVMKYDTTSDGELIKT